MEPAALSIFVWGIYVLGMGINLLTTPKLLAKIIRVEPPTDYWVFVAGLLAACLGVLYLYIGQLEITSLYTATLITRGIGFFSLHGIAISGKGPKQLHFFGMLDGISALWTFLVM